MKDPFCRNCCGCDGADGDDHGDCEAHMPRCQVSSESSAGEICKRCGNFLCHNTRQDIIRCKGFIPKGIGIVWVEEVAAA